VPAPSWRAVIGEQDDAHNVTHRHARTQPCGCERFSILAFDRSGGSELKATAILPRQHLARRKAGLRFDRSEKISSVLVAQYLATTGALKI